MLTKQERLARNAAGQAQAEALAGELKAKAEAEGAHEIDKIRAETARLMVENAATMAKLFHRDEVERRQAELVAWGDDCRAQLAQEVTSLMKAGHTKDSAPVLAKLERKHEEMAASIDDHALTVWLEAVDKLTALARGADVVAPEAPSTKH